MLRPAVFLDRDGVINRRHRTLVRRWNQFVFQPTAIPALARLASSEYAVIVATNQEWVAWGYITEENHADVHARMTKEVEAAGGRIDAVYACTHRHTAGCECRKPKPGMLLQAAKDHSLDLERSWFVGDNRKDMLAGRAAGVRTILVDPRLRTLMQGAAAHADVVAPDLAAAVDIILASHPE